MNPEHVCDICGAAPVTATIRTADPEGSERLEQFCQQHAPAGSKPPRPPGENPPPWP